MVIDDLIVGQKVKIIKGSHSGKTGVVTNFNKSNKEVKINIEGLSKTFNINDLESVDAYGMAFKKQKNNNKVMEKLVVESLDELFENKREKVNKNLEKSKPTKVDQDKKEKAKQAIDALKKELAKAKKPGAFKSTSEKNAKIKEIETKIAAWEKKLK